jgi:uncharacterized protein YjbI with pentapeptide repeats
VYNSLISILNLAPVVPSLSDAILYCAKLSGADLSTDLKGAYLMSADLSGAHLTHANLRDADLSDAKLTGANLYRASLSGAHLTRANLSDANLDHAYLSGADLSDANLSDANLSRAYLGGAFLSVDRSYPADPSSPDLDGANLSRADLNSADLTSVNLTRAILSDANLANAMLRETIFANLDLTSVIGLEACHHHGPSIIDHVTLQKSGPLPISFLRGVGLPERSIEYLPTLLNQAIQYYSCFISYSTKDQEFADRIYADLRNRGVRCWFAPHDMPIGGKILDVIDEAIRLRDKLLLILSEHSIKSDWVEDEVTKAFEEERKRGQTVLFPIRLDNAVMNTDEAWAGKLRANRNIGDFRQWNDYDAYSENLNRVIRDLSFKPTRS